LTTTMRDRILAGIPTAMATTIQALNLFKSKVEHFQEEIANFGSAPTRYASLVDSDGNLQLYDGLLRFRSADGEILEEGIPGERYADYIGEATLRNSYLKAPYFKPADFPQGAYRVGPLARLNAADQFGTSGADAELLEFRQRYGRMPHSAFLYHHARLVEILYTLERMQVLLAVPEILDSHVRATAGVNALEGIGVIEAPRGLLIHHYKVDDDGGIVWANLIVATGHNNLAIGESVEQVSRHFIRNGQIQEGMLNRVSAVVRAYDPCLSCSTHALGSPALQVRLVGPRGNLLDMQESR
jgi:NAD-reducing hydrogenase large subunit